MAGKTRILGGAASLAVAVLIVALVAATPLSQLVNLMDPFRGVAASASVGVVRGS